MKREKLLIVDDEKNIRRSIKMICEGEGYRVLQAEDAAAALNVMQDDPADLVLLDINMPGVGGLELLQTLREKWPDLLVIMISGFATIENAVTATRYGAYDFIEKPIHKEKLLLAVKNALKSRSLERENRSLKKQFDSRYAIIGRSDALQAVLKQIERVAPTEGRVLILGESGTGKELLARAIHENSSRSEGPFVKVNCAAIPEELIESELFGSVRGAFTGAVETREGKFSQADGGTLFLDEVGDMSLKVQAKVLRALQEGEFEKVGGNKTERVDVRVVAATNKDLEAEVAAGNFREDLFFRLNVIPIISPPLRSRREDVPLLVQHFIDSYCQENGLRPIEVLPEAMTVLQKYDWPGNIRELRNLVERLVIMAPAQQVSAADLPTALSQPVRETSPRFAENLTLREVRELAEKQHIIETLNQVDWNISKAARILDIDRTNLHKKIKLYALSPQKNHG